MPDLTPARIDDPRPKKAAMGNYPSVASMPTDLPSITPTPGGDSMEVHSYLAGAWRSWTTNMEAKYPTVFPLLGVLIPEEDLRAAVIAIRTHVAHTLSSSSALFEGAKDRPGAPQAALEIVQELLSLHFRMFLGRMEASLESNSDPNTRLLTGGPC